MDRAIGKTFFIFGVAVVSGALLGYALGQFAIWGTIIAIKLIAPHTNVAALLQRFAWPGMILFVVVGVSRALRMARYFLREPEESF